MPSVVSLEKKLLHYTSKAIHDYRMIRSGDRVLVCVSGGKDSYTLLSILRKIQRQAGRSFDLAVFTLDQSQPGWDDSGLRAWLEERKIPYHIRKRDTYSVVKEKVPEGRTYCSLCSRLRRGNIYQYAEREGYNKVALGHHRDDLIESLLMSILYAGQVRSMPPKLLSDSGQTIVIRPLVYCQEKDIAAYAQHQQYPIIPCRLCGSQGHLMRGKVKRLIASLADDNPHVPSNILHALQAVQVSQLMDRSLWDFEGLDQKQADLLVAAQEKESVLVDD